MHTVYDCDVPYGLPRGRVKETEQPENATFKLLSPFL